MPGDFAKGAAECRERALASEGFEVLSQAEIGSTRSIVEREMESKDNDVVVLIKRKTLKGHLEKREDTAYAIAVKVPGETHGRQKRWIAWHKVWS